MLLRFTSDDYAYVKYGPAAEIYGYYLAQAYRTGTAQ